MTNYFKILTLLAFFSLTMLPSCHRGTKAEEEEVAEVNDTIYPLGFCTDDYDEVAGKVRSGEVFTSLMSRLGLSGIEANLMASVVDSVFDMRKLRAGNEYHAYYDTTGAHSLRFLVYEQDRVNSTVFKCDTAYAAWTAAKPVEIHRRYSDVTIKSSLWNDMLAAGASPLMIVKLADLYAWTVDFFGLQKGDRFRVLYDEEVCGGEIIDIQTIYYALFSREDKELPAILLDRGDGGNKYWNQAGESLRKAFLKAPLKFNRISSGFTYRRKHPVTGKVKAHTGVDYAAPTGTPVMSIGDGTVISKGWSGGGGNTVKIRHNSVYTTSYMHLSKYAAGLKSGQRVSQGQVIGYVGSTGMSTGPHLDFRVWMNGSPINPLKMESPPTEPLPKEFMPALDSVSALYRHELDSLVVAQ